MTRCHSEAKGRKVWKAGIHYDCSRKEGVAVFAHFGHLTPCGQWVDGGSVRWPRTPEWCDTEAEALARLAPEIAEIGARLIAQSWKLIEAASVHTHKADPGLEGLTASAPGMPPPAVG